MPTASRKTVEKKKGEVRKNPIKKSKSGNDNEGIGLGASSPSFLLPATKVGQISLAKLKGKPFVLYFYPKDDTSGCTAEACGFRDAVPAFSKLGITVIGVSKDSIESHEKFSKKYNLSFPLISDKDADLCEKFGVWKQKSMYGRTYMGIERSTFLVDAKGKMRAIWRKVSVPGHVDEVKAAIAGLE